MTKLRQIIVNLLILALAIYLITLGVLGFRLLWDRNIGRKGPVSKTKTEKKKKTNKTKTNKTRTGEKPIGEPPKPEENKPNVRTVPFLPYKPNSWRKPPSKIEPPSPQKKKSKPQDEEPPEFHPEKKRRQHKVHDDDAMLVDPSRNWCINQLQTLRMDLLKYAMMHDGMTPDSENLLEALEEGSGHSVDGKYLECPLGRSYLYLGGGRDVIREEGDFQLFRCPTHSVSITSQGKFPKKEK